MSKGDAQLVLDHIDNEYEECHQKALADLENHPVPEVLNTAVDSYRNHLKESAESFRSIYLADI